MTSPHSHAEGLAEIDAMIAEQDRKEAEREARHAAALKDPRVLRGVEAVIRANIEEFIAPAATDATAKLVDDLLGFGLIEEERYHAAWVPDLAVGHIAVVNTPDSMYAQIGPQLVEI